jgi:16S rRNA (cytosine967-C5)-methyltransferase
MLDRVPARAAIHESVELVKRAKKRSAAPFVNALLRKISADVDWVHEFRPGLETVQQQEIISPESAARVVVETQSERGLLPENFARRYAHPHWLVERWVKKYGWEATRSVCRYDQEPRPPTIRIPSHEIEQELENSGVVLNRGRLLSSAATVERGDITRTAPFVSGKIAIQDEASQLVALLLGEGSRILDCCAAPGSKTAVLAERQAEANVVAVELHAHRARLMQERVSAPNLQIINADIRDLPVDSSYDRVLADAPCSGTGTLARNPEIKWRLKVEDLTDLQSRQLAILTAAMKHVARGGRLLYSTCSLEPEENEDVVRAALHGNPNFQIVDCHGELLRLRSQGELAWENMDSLLEGPFLRTIPGVHPSDGFFAAMLERADS